jgi:hypothetical protein
MATKQSSAREARQTKSAAPAVNFSAYFFGAPAGARWIASSLRSSQ